MIDLKTFVPVINRRYDSNHDEYTYIGVDEKGNKFDQTIPAMPKPFLLFKDPSNGFQTISVVGIGKDWEFVELVDAS